MIFTTYWFLLFAACFFTLYWSFRREQFRYWLLLGACLIFHGHFAGPAGVIPIAILGAVTFLAGRSRNKRACIGAITLCVGALIFYKYTLFFSTSLLQWLAPELQPAVSIQVDRWLPTLPPLAISFFTFEFVHYLVDVYRGREPIRRARDFVLFTAYFPTLVAGPIKRYQQFIPAIQGQLTKVTSDDVRIGITRVALGFFKKVVVSDNITLALRFYERDFHVLPPGESWLFLAGLAARILLDFSGYSDIAIGLARMMGITIPENFRYPYVAVNLQDFWQRWHISLSTWIRDYVYIPLGGNRHGVARKALNGLGAFALCGLWHGAAWNFVLWGLWHGVGLAIQSTYQSCPGGIGRALAWPFAHVPLLSRLLTLLFVAFGWLLFFYPVDVAWSMATKLLSFK